MKMTESVRKHGQTNVLWDRAYDNFSRQNEKLEAAFRQILSLELSDITISSQDAGKTKEGEMSELVSRQLSRMEAREWKLTFGAKSVRIRPQVDRILKILSVVQGMGLQAAAIDPLHASLPVAGLYLVLAFAIRDKESRDVLLDGLEDISNIVRWTTSVESVYITGSKNQDTLPLEDVMVKLYERILGFEAEAACRFNHNIAYQTFQNLLKGTSNLKAQLASIKQAESACKNLLPILDQKASTEHVESIVDELQKLRVSQEHAQEANEHRQLLVSLRTTDYEGPLKGHRIPLRIAGTCNWFLDHSEYHSWLKATTPALLWTTAYPGCGKSVLAKFLINEFTKISSVASHVCYYFFRAGTENESALAALCAVLHQLFSQNKQLLERHGMPHFYQNGDKLASLFEPLWEMFTEVCHDLDRDEIILVIDALDECEVTYRVDLVRRLAELLANLPQNSRVKILMTSIPDTLLGNALYAVFSFQKFAFHRIKGESENQALAQEINLVIEQSIDLFKMTREAQGIYDNVHETLCSRISEVSNRTYLWVAVVFVEIQENAGASKDELLTTLRDLPDRVESAYERRLARIPLRKIEDAKKLLRIILAAERELTLQELKVAFTVRRDGSYEQLKPTDDRSFQDTVTHWCGLLVRVEGAVVSLIHQTARDYLTKSLSGGGELSQQWEGAFDTVIANKVLAQSCMWYLGSNVFDTEWIKQNENEKWKPSGMSLNKFIREHHFLAYAARHWMLHFNLSEDMVKGDLCMDAMKLCRTESNRYRTWSKVYWDFERRRPPAQPTDLSIPAAFNMVVLIDDFISSGYDVNTQDCDGDTALIVAIFRRAENAARALLRHGASPSLPGTDGNTPIHAAAARDMASIMESLIESGAQIEITNNDGRTPLHRAALYGHPNAVKVLLRANAKTNVADNRGRTPLHLASLLGVEDIKSRRGVDVHRYSSVISTLKNAGANQELLDDDHRNAGDMFKKSFAFWIDVSMRTMGQKLFPTLVRSEGIASI